MKTNNIIILMAAILLPSFQNKLTFFLFIWLYFILLIHTLISGYYTFYFESLGSVIGINAEFWNVTELSIILDLFILWITFLILLYLPLIYYLNNRNSKIETLTTITVKNNSAIKEKNLSSHKVDKAKGIYILNTYYFIIMFSMLLIFSFNIYSSDLLTFVVVGQNELIYLITYIVFYLSFNFVYNGLQFSDNIYEAYAQKFIILFIILILFIYIIYKIYTKSLDITSFSNEGLFTENLITTTKNLNIYLNISANSEEFLISSPNETFSIFSTFSTLKNDLYNYADNHPVDVLLFSILVLNILSLFLIFNLSVALLYKYLANSKLELKFIDKLISAKYSTTVKYYIKKLIHHSNRLTTLHIIFIILIIIFANIISIYLLSGYINNLELISKIYLGIIK